MRYACIALCGALLVMGWLYRSANKELSDTKTSLAAALEANETNRAAISRLERNIENTDKIIAGWDKDRTALARVRGAAKQQIREAMHNETFKTWASSPAPADAWRLLSEAHNQNGSTSPHSTGGAAVGLPGDPNSGKRK